MTIYFLIDGIIVIYNNNVLCYRRISMSCVVKGMILYYMMSENYDIILKKQSTIDQFTLQNHIR